MAAGEEPVRVHPAVDRLAAYSWRLLVIAAAVGGAGWVAGRIWVAFVPLVVALFLTRILAAPAGWLRARGLPASVSAALALVGFLLLLGGVSAGIGMAVANEFGDLGPTVSQAVDDLERWLVEDSPFDVERADIDRFRTEAGQKIGDSLRASGGALGRGGGGGRRGDAGPAARPHRHVLRPEGRRPLPGLGEAPVPRGAPRAGRPDSPPGPGERSAATSGAPLSSGWSRDWPSASPSPWSGPSSLIPMALVTFLAAFVPRGGRHRGRGAGGPRRPGHRRRDGGRDRGRRRPRRPADSTTMSSRPSSTARPWSYTRSSCCWPSWPEVPPSGSSEASWPSPWWP